MAGLHRRAGDVHGAVRDHPHGQTSVCGYSEDHAHIKPVVSTPPYSAATIPFRWMLRKEAWALAEEHDLDVDPGREPIEGWLEKNNWVQDHHNQRALLDAFFGAIDPSGRCASSM